MTHLHLLYTPMDAGGGGGGGDGREGKRTTLVAMPCI